MGRGGSCEMSKMSRGGSAILVRASGEAQVDDIVQHFKKGKTTFRSPLGRLGRSYGGGNQSRDVHK